MYSVNIITEEHRFWTFANIFFSVDFNQLNNSDIDYAGNLWASWHWKWCLCHKMGSSWTEAPSPLCSTPHRQGTILHKTGFPPSLQHLVPGANHKDILTLYAINHCISGHISLHTSLFLFLFQLKSCNDEKRIYAVIAIKNCEVKSRSGSVGMGFGKSRVGTGFGRNQASSTIWPPCPVDPQLNHPIYQVSD